ncbi:MAG: MATE family efflux transporter [Sodaliphilus sp.]
MGFSIPYLCACFLQLLYSMTDLYFVGKYCDVPAITAVTIGGQVLHMLTVMIVGMAMGCTVCLARAIGAKHDNEASATIGNTITLFMALSLPLTLALVFCTEAIANVMATPKEALGPTITYLKISFISIPAIVGYNVLASIFRGLGDSKSPMCFIALACVCNVLLNYLFIGCLNMGAAGAALATILSQCFSVAIAIIAILKKNSGTTLAKSNFKLNQRITHKLLQIGTPIALQDGFIQVSFILITIIANCRGLVDSAAVGIVERVIGILFLVPSALLSTVSAVSAQNLGSGLQKRAHLTLRYSIIIAITFGTLSSIIFQFISKDVMSIFTSDPRVIISGEQYLMAYVWDCVLAGIHFCYSGYFCAYGKSVLSFVHNAISIVVARIPLAYLASISFPTTLYPMGIATLAGSLLSVIICIYFYRHITQVDSSCSKVMMPNDSELRN